MHRPGPLNKEWLPRKGLYQSEKNFITTEKIQTNITPGKRLFWRMAHLAWGSIPTMAATTAPWPLAASSIVNPIALSTALREKTYHWGHYSSMILLKLCSSPHQLTGKNTSGLAVTSLRSLQQPPKPVQKTNIDQTETTWSNWQEEF